jgi:hypothetical protein
MNKSSHGTSVGNRLVAFGDSFTQGCGLEKNISHLSTQGEYSKKAYPSVTASFLSTDLHNPIPFDSDNRGLGGTGNCDILDEILNYDIQPNDIALIMWTSPYREAYMSLPSEIGTTTWNHAFIEDNVCNNFRRTFFEQYQSKIAVHKRLERTLYIADSYLKQKCKAVIHIPGPWFKIYDPDTNTPPEDTFDFHLYEWHNFEHVLQPFNQLDVAPFDEHFGISSHKNLARILRDYIQTHIAQ